MKIHTGPIQKWSIVESQGPACLALSCHRSDFLWAFSGEVKDSASWLLGSLWKAQHGFFGITEIVQVVPPVDGRHGSMVMGMEDRRSPTLLKIRKGRSAH
jgi:hypothetical protein